MYNTCIWNLESQYWWTYLQGSSGDTGVEKDFWTGGLGRKGEGGADGESNTGTCTLLLLLLSHFGPVWRCATPHVLLWRRKWQPTPVHLPGKSQGRRSLVGYSPWGCRVRHDRVIGSNNSRESLTMKKYHFLLQRMHACQVASLMSNSMRPYGQRPTRFLCPQDSLGKNIGVGYHFLLRTYTLPYVK